MEPKEIGEISRDFIEKYTKLERSVDRLLLSNSSTRLDDYKLRYQKDLDVLHSTDFETFLIRGKHLAYILKTLAPRKISPRWIIYHDASEPLLLKLAIMRIISGALLVYSDPLSFGYDAASVGAIKPNLLDIKTQKDTERLLARFDDKAVPISLHTRAELMRITRGEHPQRTPDFIENKELSAQFLIRELSILSNAFLFIDNSKAGRLPKTVTHRILSIVDADGCARWIDKYQKPFDDQVSGALTDNMTVLVDRD